MSTATLRGSCLAALLLTIVGPSSAQDAPRSARGEEAELIALLKSNASREVKASACRRLSLVGTRESVPSLSALLGDEALGHMARYALEPIPDPSVDTALRDALRELKGRPLVGVIGSIGVRRDDESVDRLAGLLKDNDAEVVQAAAKALGRIGTDAAVKALESGLATATHANWPAFYEGLFRGADAMAARGRTAEALAIYGKLTRSEAPPQVRDGAARKARLLGQEPGQRL
jgi:HEAT repeat protein